MPFPLVGLSHPLGWRKALLRPGNVPLAQRCMALSYLSVYFKSSTHPQGKKWAIEILMLELDFLTSLTSSHNPLLEKATSRLFLKAQNLSATCFPLGHTLFLLWGNQYNGLKVISRRGILFILWGEIQAPSHLVPDILKELRKFPFSLYKICLSNYCFSILNAES